jgi:hypothetical protein
MLGLGGIFGKIISAFVSLYETILSYPKRAVLSASAVLIGLAVFLGGWWAARLANGGGGTSYPLPSEKAPKSLSQLLRETAPDEAYLREIPPKTRVETVRVKVPKYITERDTVYRVLDTARGILDFEKPELNISATFPNLRKGFLLLPLKNGNPTVKVGNSRTLIDVVNPTNARTATLEYAHNIDYFDFGPYLGGTYIPRFTTRIEVGTYATYRNRVKLDLGASFDVYNQTIRPMVGIRIEGNLTD